MATRIRLKRLGRKKKAVYRVVVSETRVSRNGKHLDHIGFYNPLVEPVEFRLEEDKLKNWLSRGATPSDTVERLLGAHGFIPKKERKSSNQKVTKKTLKENSNKTE